MSRKKSRSLREKLLIISRKGLELNRLEQTGLQHIEKSKYLHI